MSRHRIPVAQYDLGLTLQSGQSFSWKPVGTAWEGLVGPHWVRLGQAPSAILAETAVPMSDWSWLTHYLQTDVDLKAVLASFPDDPPMQASIRACRGLRLLRQDPWECLASFILSSCKQIVQIQQIVTELRMRFGQPTAVPAGHTAQHAFPAPDMIAAQSEQTLRDCRMGWRAASLLTTSQMVASGELDLSGIGKLPLEEARRRLMTLPGVGEKIANCVLLFAYGFPTAFPVDVWVQKALRELYFPRRKPKRARLEKFIATHFGPHSGYAQQYLFHYMRTRQTTPLPA